MALPCANDGLCTEVVPNMSWLCHICTQFVIRMPAQGSHYICAQMRSYNNEGTSPLYISFA
jgi:hypothetical protein